MTTTRTALDLITASLQTLGVYGAAETLSSEDSSLALDYLQDLLAEWSDGGLTVPCTVTEAITLVVGQVSYTVGDSGSPGLNTTRPDQIIGAFVRDSSNQDFPVEIIGKQAYDQLALKSDTSGRPDRIFVNYTSPNLTVYCYPEPDAIESLYIVSIKPFKEPATLTEELLATTQIPRNFYNALKFNLAMELSLPFLREPNPLLVKRAQETKRVIRNLNMARMAEAVPLDFSTRSRMSSLADFFEG